jgi:hypothetical protein
VRLRSDVAFANRESILPALLKVLGRINGKNQSSDSSKSIVHSDDVGSNYTCVSALRRETMRSQETDQNFRSLGNSKMKNRINVCIAFALSLYTGCWAADNTTKPTNDLGKNTANAMKNAGNEVDKAEHAITSSVKNMGKDNSKGSKNSKPSNDFQKDASNAMNTLGKDANQAEHAITSAVKGAGKDTTNKGEKGKSESGNSWNHSMNEFGENANKAGAAIQKDMKDMGQQAGTQIKKAEHATGASSESKTEKNGKATNDWQKNASNAMHTLGKEANQTEKSVSNAFQGVDKKKHE